jgi:isopentenyl-diphosphate delta-isomerase type 1
MSEFVILVDENDTPIGQQEKLKAHQLAQCHRAFSVFIYRLNTQNDIALLLQQRHVEKYHCGGLWTNTCCGHPRPGEDTLVAASRRLFEEMGIQSTLKEVGVFHYIAPFENGLTENEVDHVFLGMMDNEKIIPHPEEIHAYRWISVQDLKIELHEKPEQFTPWLQQALNIVSFVSPI